MKKNHYKYEYRKEPVFYMEEQGTLDPKRRKWEICLYLFKVVFSEDRMVSMSLDPG